MSAWAPLVTIGGVVVEINAAAQAVRYTSGAAIDADGAPHAAHPEEHRGLDRHANVRGAIVRGPDGAPVVQGPHDPAPGFYVVATSLIDRSRRRETDPRRYVDSEAVPYVALPPELVSTVARPSAHLPHVGDLAWARCSATGRESWAIVGDVGPAGRIGEVSIALAHALGIPADPRRGGCEGGVETVVFVGSRAAVRWPRPDAATVAAGLWRGLRMD